MVKAIKAIIVKIEAIKIMVKAMIKAMVKAIKAMVKGVKVISSSSRPS